ncbi:MAG: fumarylacetoacetate hydrolase family protein [Ignavibacteriaceae bacterium]|nr:fumarylacetoacetate hydrolase family protein [Ignavibacteriaceae bacterium]
MKFVSYYKDSKFRVGILVNDVVIDVEDGSASTGKKLPATMKELLEVWNESLSICESIVNNFHAGNTAGVNLDELKLGPPVPYPTSCRDGYAFRQHVATARRNRGVPMIPEFDQYPVFYFTNHNAIYGGGDLIVETDHLQKLDFELEAAIVIGRHGRNIKSYEADNYIAGYMIMNDFSARVLQMEEMLLNLGPAKGKDFATAIGPVLVTPDELENRKVTTPYGDKYDLEMKAYHNGRLISEGNLKQMDWTFAEIIERASYGVDLYPGDIIGSGTVGTGCYLELNGTAALNAKEKGEEFTPVWLAEGDDIELQIEGLGRLKNTIRRAVDDYSLLARKKMNH